VKGNPLELPNVAEAAGAPRVSASLQGNIDLFTPHLGIGGRNGQALGERNTGTAEGLPPEVGRPTG
jgi:hypothetical protein